METLNLTKVRRTLEQATKRTITDPSLSPAAVLVLVYLKEGQYCTLLNKRTNSVAEHKGEVAFPGGKKEASDTGLQETALREAFEEMAIQPDDVKILGELDDVATSSKYVITPFVGTILHPYLFTPDEREVAEILEVPLGNLDNPRNVRQEARLKKRRLVSDKAYTYNGHLIFGATAKVLHMFLDLINHGAPKGGLWAR